MSHWQYLAHVEPVLPIARTGSPAQVHADLPDLPPGRAAFVVALFTVVSTFVPAPVQAATPTGWQSEMATPMRAIARVATFETGAERPLEIPRSQHITWQPQLDIVPRRIARAVTFETGAECPIRVAPQVQVVFVPPLLETGRPASRPMATFETGAERPVFVATPVTEFLRWLPQMDDAPRRRPVPAAVETGAERPLEVPRSQHITWTPAMSLPPTGARRVISFATGAEWVPRVAQVSVEWARPLEEPARTGPRAVEFRTGAEWVRVPPARPLDWLVELGMPVWPRPQTPPWLGECVPVVGSTEQPGGLDLVGRYTPTIDVIGRYDPTLDVVGRYNPTIDVVGHFED